MLTASLQSTWETQRSRQARPKYLQSNPYGDDSSESKGYGSDEKNGTQRGYGNGRDISMNGSTDLPNLRIPSVCTCWFLPSRSNDCLLLAPVFL
jgi:hypothetical protein